MNLRELLALALFLLVAACAVAVFPPALEAATGDANVTQLRLGERVSLNALGPIVVHADCTVRRIENWDVLTTAEQKRTQQRVAARNRVRLAACQELQEAGLLSEGGVTEGATLVGHGDVGHDEL